jgi:hypothetical protein
VFSKKSAFRHRVAVCLILLWFVRNPGLLT